MGLVVIVADPGAKLHRTRITLLTHVVPDDMQSHENSSTSPVLVYVSEADYLGERHGDALALLAAVQACGVDCRADLPVIKQATYNFAAALAELQDHAVQTYGWYVSWCCQSAEQPRRDNWLC